MDRTTLSFVGFVETGTPGKDRLKEHLDKTCQITNVRYVGTAGNQEICPTPMNQTPLQPMTVMGTTSMYCTDRTTLSFVGFVKTGTPGKDLKERLDETCQSTNVRYVGTAGKSSSLARFVALITPAGSQGPEVTWKI